MSVTAKDIKEELRKQSATIPDPGEQISICHTKCPAGEDTRNRLFIKRDNLNTRMVLWYCHNCGEGGGFKHHGWRGRRATPVAARDDDPDRYWREGIPWRETPLSSGHSLWLGTINAASWLENEKLRYHPGEDALMWPMRVEEEGDGEVSALQLRWNDGRRAKCRTLLSREVREQGSSLLQAECNYACSIEPQTVVFVEDYLSAQKILSTDINQMHVVPLWGTHAKMEDLHELLQDPLGLDGARAIVWLDNDNDVVKKAARKLKNRLEVMGFDPVHVVDGSCDPKLEPMGSIEDTLRAYMHR